MAPPVGSVGLKLKVDAATTDAASTFNFSTEI